MRSFKTDNLRYQTAAEFFSNKENYNRRRASPIFDQGTSDDVVKAVVKPLIDLEFKVEKLSKEFNANINQYKRDLYNPDKEAREIGTSLTLLAKLMQLILSLFSTAIIILQRMVPRLERVKMRLPAKRRSLSVMTAKSIKLGMR